MRYAPALLAVAVPALVSAAPIGRRAGPSSNDILVFQFADVLEQLETQFYQQALNKYQASDITGAGFQNPDLLVEQLKAIQSDEATHASVLESAIDSFGQSVLSKSCNFDFTSLLTDLPTTLSAARLVENLGVTAYVGAAHILDDADLLSAAASIATVEARHQTILNVLSGGGTVIPQAFDLALLPNEVLATAGQFISGCDLGVPANAALAVSPAAPQPGNTLTFNSSAITGDMSSMFCQIMSGNIQDSSNATVLAANNCTIPENLNGPIAVFITSDDTPLPNDPVARASINNTVAGPALSFVDQFTELLPMLVRQLSTPVGKPATTTIITSSGNAQTIIAGANGTDTAAFIPEHNTVCSGCDQLVPGKQNDFTGNTQAGGIMVIGFGVVDPATDGSDSSSSDAASTGSSDASASSTDSSSASSTDSSAPASSTDSSADASPTDSSSDASSTDSSSDASSTDSSSDASSTDSSSDASSTDSASASDATQSSS